MGIGLVVRPSLVVSLTYVILFYCYIKDLEYVFSIQNGTVLIKISFMSRCCSELHLKGCKNIKNVNVNSSGLQSLSD